MRVAAVSEPWLQDDDEASMKASRIARAKQPICR
eukprot:CAMPEP_0113697906 /NCGR_PEP_ID=MMETSP0038_2-20120614/22400_1 /TAXON_ID=2898 /ORGANISM="Cryptomonas paramecium" /LENGTH=33 /DNA_ID=CAMNT_0000620981 /DNA_START=117 /DNA_END=218 /DNA_ORIENTATION=- /assembly_acc=CAM_ASM_000170